MVGPIAWWQLGACAVLVVATVVALLRNYGRAVETTLVSAWWWMLAAIAVLGVYFAADVLLGRKWEDALEAWRFTAAALLFCPAVSLMGAKRPQHAAWNFVVLSLWGVVALPAAEALVMQRGQGINAGDARGWFLWILILLGPINFVPTRYWFPSLAVAAAQVLLLSEHLPLVRRSFDAANLLAAVSLLSAVLVTAWLTRRAPAQVSVPSCDRLWIDFRDAFGLFWALRVQERVNAAATMYGWDFLLTWQGFRQVENGLPVVKLDAAAERALRQTLTGLLRRFVSAKWIGERFPERID